MQNNLVDRLKGTAFNIALFLAAAYLFYLAGNFQYDVRENQLGPGFWPKLLLGLVIVLTFYDIVLGLVKGSTAGEAKGVLSNKDQENQEAGDGLLEEEKKRYPMLLIIGCVITLAYVYLVSIIGFPICTFLYLLGFMYAGRYRRHTVIIVSSLVGTLFFMFLFIKVVYVSLPTGVPPFEGLTLMLYSLLGIH
ncbi:MAG: tripartite tricarboxylate transporter TctB family protein [Desulfocucumaceae bacterium]